MQNGKIIYFAIVRKKRTVLTEYTDCSGNFSQITIGIMDEIINELETEPNQYKAKFTYGKYIFYFLKNSNLYMLAMAKPTKNKSNNDDIFFYNCLYNIHDIVSKKIDVNNVQKLRAYSLSSFLPEIKEKVNQFNNGEMKLNNNNKNDIEKFDLLNDKAFNESKEFPILSNEQVHAEKNISKEDNINDIGESYENTIDSFNEDILKSTLLEKNNLVNVEDAILPMKSINSTDFDLNFREKKRKSKWKKIVFLIIFIVIIALILLDMFVFKLVIKI